MRWPLRLFRLIPLTRIGWGTLLLCGAFLALALRPGISNPKSSPPAVVSPQCGTTAVALHTAGAWLRNAWQAFYHRTSAVLPWGDHILFWMGSAGILLLVLLGTNTLLWAAFLRVRPVPELAELKMEQGETKPSGLRISGLRWMPWLRISGSWSGISGAEVTYDHAGQEMVAARRRGQADDIVRALVLTDALRLTAFRLRIPANQSYRALPRECRISAQFLSAVLQVGEQEAQHGKPQGDRFDIREYQRGDRARDIHWKLALRSGGKKLYVRMPETVRNSCVGLFLLAGAGDDDSASLVQYCLKTLQSGDWFFGTSHASEVVQDKESAFRLLAASGAYAGDEPEANAAAIKHFVIDAQRRACRNNYVFIPPGAAAWSVLEQFPADYTLVIGYADPKKKPDSNGRTMLMEQIIYV